MTSPAATNPALTKVDRRVLETIRSIGQLPTPRSNFERAIDFVAVAYDLEQRGMCDVDRDGRWHLTYAGQLEATR